jgi:hypothetical protein
MWFNYTLQHPNKLFEHKLNREFVQIGAMSAAA